MYEQAFGLTSRPFTSAPFVGNYFPGESIHHALLQIQLSIDRASGPVIATGPSGSGKSLLLAMLAQHFENQFQIINLVCGHLVDRRDLLQNILFELRLPYRDSTEGELRLSLLDFLKSNRVDSNRILLLVDEAHGLSSDLLDELRLITNFVHNGEAIVSLVMAGAPSLEDHLIETKSESFNQRIAARCYLTNLSQKETIEYVVTHIERAGGNGEQLFTDDALKLIHRASDGCPRVINQICDYSLVLAASQNSPRVTAELVQNAWNDVQSIPCGGFSSSETYANTDDQESAGIPSEDDGLMVIEFGQLDDGDESTSDTTESTTEATQTSNESQLAICQDEEEDDFLAATECSTADDSEETIQITNVVSEFDEMDADLVDRDYAIADEPGGNRSVDEFDNPFDETFAAEESISASYFPVISEQNINSLTLTSDHLQFLDSVPVNPTSSIPEENMEWEEASTHLKTEEIAGAQAVHVDDGLRLSAQGLSDLDQVEADIKRLQRDLTFTENQFMSKAVHPDFSTSPDNQPPEELLQSHPVAEAPIVQEEIQDNQATDAADAIVYVQQTDELSDDQDIMIIHEGDCVEDHNRVQADDYLVEEPHISTGVATRMDYVELFHQLRTPE